MQYTEFNKTPDGNLQINLLVEGRQYIGESVDEGKSIHSDDFFRELIEYQLCNGWEIVAPELIGALTNATILSDQVRYDEDGKIMDVGSVYTDINFYQITSAVEKMFDNGYVVFTQHR